MKLSKKERILHLLDAGWTRAAIATELNCSVNYVSQMRWYARHPEYKGQWMRRKREDPAYAEKERQWQREHRRHRPERSAP